MESIWRRKRIVLPAVVAVVLFAAAFWYVNDYYHSEDSVQDYMERDGLVSVTEIKDGLFIDGPGEEDALVFYPGAKVEYTAYLPLMYELASQGIDCFLIKMPCNLAFLGQSKAEKIIEEYSAAKDGMANTDSASPSMYTRGHPLTHAPAGRANPSGSSRYEHWYLAGHSLGGAMAASYASKHLSELDGLVLLAAYPTSDIKSDGFSVMSIYGSEDGVLNMEKVENGREFMPDDYTEVCIEGGNHAYFGNYGQQEGDREAEISREQQQKETAEAILEMVKGR